VRACPCAGVLCAHKNNHIKVEAHTQNWAAESRVRKIGQHDTSTKLGGSITPRKIGLQELITNTRKNSCIIRKFDGSITPIEKHVCVGVFVRAYACAGVLGAHKNQHRNVQAHTQNWAAASRLGKNGRQHHTSRKLGGSITPRKHSAARINYKHSQKQWHHSENWAAACPQKSVRVWACLCVRMRVWACWAHTKTNTERFRRTQKPTQKGSGAHTKLGGSITPRTTWAAASHFEKIGRQHYIHRKVCVCGRVGACVCVCGRIGRTQKPTQQGPGAHKKLGRRITPRENWAAALHVEKIGRQHHAKKNWAARINYKHSQKQMYLSENWAVALRAQKSVRVWACLCVRVRERAYWAHTKTNTERFRRAHKIGRQHHA